MPIEKDFCTKLNSTNIAQNRRFKTNLEYKTKILWPLYASSSSFGASSGTRVSTEESGCCGKKTSDEDGLARRHSLHNLRNLLLCGSPAQVNGLSAAKKRNLGLAKGPAVGHLVTRAL